MSIIKRIKVGGGGALVVALALTLAPSAGAGVAGQERHPHFGSSSEQITNPYLPISKFKRCVLKGDDEGQNLRIVRTLQKGTRTLPFRGHGVEAAIVKDRVFDLDAKQLIEKTTDFFAQDKAGGVHYLGEHVNEYKNGHLAGHGGQWLLGRDTKRPGLLMPAHPKVGDHFRSEIVPGITVERDRVIGKEKQKTVRGHTYKHVIRIREHAVDPKPGDVEYKTYAPGAGVITEANNGVGLVGCK